MSTEKLQPILEGYLKKQSPKGLLVKPWQERYFVLQPNGEILYYASHQSMSEVTGRIKLRTITEIGVSKKNGCLIEIQALKKGSPRTYLLMANNSSDARMWLDNIEDVRQRCKDDDVKALGPKLDTMSMAFYCPGDYVIVQNVKADQNMYEVKADLFGTAKNMRKPIAGVPEDYLVVLKTENLDLPEFFLEDIRGELGQHPSFAEAFAQNQLWKATVKPLTEMSELKV
eukprot:TRINITY_DN3517_c0_g1_i2.p1 TRINITY_DN3517_c0_g1~~TRINITY_DN3517_c0_g1_i2.p1  ORF type:complete len:228 (-),score=50.10 TRINITY_DN3517_c0_g1_i2:190-873(-)